VLNKSKSKVLIAEDKTITALNLKELVESLDCEVVGIVKTGEEVIEKITSATPDLILMDIMLKGYYTGIEAAEILKRDHDIPLIYITALTDDETYLRAYMTGPAAIIIKPFTEQILTRIIRETLSGQRYGNTYAKI
jgi:DNA-binding NarL/FixJ family response regulator